ncbi:Methylated DNA-protein cysteine methyltransferase [Ignavibacterium album JCM 16511]|uniref:Methylated-DNA--protein-cysteine methyltransferase n=1 Tax=Ignavibacterium album (strain DSM 19864 / JCM 16511 / NBRC 101810 / Mat9-16) TaxID=945713 RepID=I0AP93_IGNAJ|nr:methylated-DNA--[protein]-cysteine S-methyltransferase [Ignavibacterium album]AFH50800.1 Methylated DNA-protein cysteine methyltransferase [Ignavibacterium album JCM 16511]
MKEYFYSQKIISDIHFIVITDGKALKRVLINSALPSSSYKFIRAVPTHKYLLDTFSQLEEYFFEGRKEFSVPLNPDGSEFQKKVWNELLKIPFGKTISYQQLAERVGDKKSIRAVGKANATNPIPIIIPCHRVVGKNGSLVGYSAGLEIKKKLLKLEESLELNLFE